MDSTAIDIVEPMRDMETGNNTGLLDTSADNIMYLAEKADKMITAMNKIMSAALKITSEHDWTLIGGKPYLQESGATKVARLFGISWQIGNPKIECDAEGYKTFTYKGRFEMRGQFIECEGSRSMKDDFFGGKPDARKSVDEISERNVRQAAYTNCINNGIKRIIPGLRGIDVKTLEEAGIDTRKMKGYTFKDGSKGGTSKMDSNLKCEKCGASISQNVASYSQSHHDGHMYCMDCQKVVSAGGIESDSAGNK
ncbi:MAG: hypothetical protein HFG42_13980 [Lachnospiraceae bacterium]|jgi:hypothetical protein|nr:hypothetical protein [Lachnospiraceae bacterium]